MIRRRTCYLASPIDQAKADRGLPLLREDAILALTDVGLTTYNPAAAWTVPISHRDSSYSLPPSIGTTDFAALDGADTLLALLPDGVPTLGVPMEIERALGLGLPVAVVCGKQAARSPLLAGRVAIYPETELAHAARFLEINSREARSTERVLKITGPGHLTPPRHVGDVGFDLHTLGGPHVIGPGEFRDIPCGVSVEPPPGLWGLILGRSSAIRKKGLLVHAGVIDGGFRGTLYAGVTNIAIPGGPVTVEPDERIAQLIPMPIMSAGLTLKWAEQLNSSDRGEAGWGSTGR